MLAEFERQYGVRFRDPGLLKLALTHRSYLSVTGQGPRESNERLEFLGDSVLGLVTSEFLYRRRPDEHEGQLTKIKSLLVSKAILSRRALKMGLGRFVLMSHSEVESGGRQRLSILADAFESVLGAVYLDQGFETAREFIHTHLLDESDAIVADKRHTNYKSHLQEYVQSTFRTHPVYRIRGENGPDHSKYFVVEVMVGRRTLGEGRGHNKKEAEQAAARDALERVEGLRREIRERRGQPAPRTVEDEQVPRERGGVAAPERDDDEEPRRRRGRRRGGRDESREQPREAPREARPIARVERAIAPTPAAPRSAPPRRPLRADDYEEEVGRPEGPLESLHVDPYGYDEPAEPPIEAAERLEEESDDEDFEPAPARDEDLPDEDADTDVDVDDADEEPWTAQAPERETTQERMPERPAPEPTRPEPRNFGRRGRRGR